MSSQLDMSYDRVSDSSVELSRKRERGGAFWMIFSSFAAGDVVAIRKFMASHYAGDCFFLSFRSWSPMALCFSFLWIIHPGPLLPPARPSLAWPRTPSACLGLLHLTDQPFPGLPPALPGLLHLPDQPRHGPPPARCSTPHLSVRPSLGLHPTCPCPLCLPASPACLSILGCYSWN